MNSIEFKSNADTLKKSTPLSSEDVCSKCTNPSLNAISSFPASTSSTSVPYTKNDPSENSESSHNNSILEKDSLVPLGNPNLKNLKYVESEIPIYANLYKIELERNYTLYEYAVNFLYEKDDIYSLSTPFKQRIINTVSSKIAQKFKNFIFIGSALFSEKKSKKLLKFLQNIIQLII